jgi:transposase
VVGEARRTGNDQLLATLRDSRWAVLKNPQNLTDGQRLKLAQIQQINNPLYRAYLLKEQFRQIFAPGGEERILTLDEWLLWAARCRIPEFVELARKMRRYRDDIANTLTHGLSNAIVEGLNARVRLLINMARGFRSVEALMALMPLHLGGHQPTLPGRPQFTPA